MTNTKTTMGAEYIDTSNEACAVACMLVSSPDGQLRRDGDGWQRRVNDLIRALRDERNGLLFATSPTPPGDGRIAVVKIAEAFSNILHSLEVGGVALTPQQDRAWQTATAKLETLKSQLTALPTKSAPAGDVELPIGRLIDGVEMISCVECHALLDHMNSRLAKAEADMVEARHWLAGTDIGSLPNDWTLAQIAEASWDDICKLRDQVRDTCHRAEAAEACIAELEQKLANALKEKDHHVEEAGKHYQNGLKTVGECLARVEVLEKALEPFAKQADTHGDKIPDAMWIDDYERDISKPWQSFAQITVGQLRNARVALSTKSSEEGKI